MALVTFVDDIPPYLNAQNLNNNFNLLNGKPYMGSAGLSTTSPTITSGTWTKVALDTLDKIDNVFELSNGGLKITADNITKAFVVAKLRFNTGGNCGVGVRKNNSSYNFIVINQDIGNYRTMEVSGIIDIAKNDVLYLYGYNGSANTTAFGALSDGKPLFVEISVMAF